MIFKYSKPANPNVPEEVRVAARAKFKKACKHHFAMQEMFGIGSERAMTAYNMAAAVRHTLEDLGILSSEELDAIAESIADAFEEETGEVMA